MPDVDTQKLTNVVEGRIAGNGSSSSGSSSNKVVPLVSGMFVHLKNDVMISYSRKDTEFVKRLVVQLNTMQIDPWIDWEDIPPAIDWLEKIKSGIENAYAMIIVLSPDYLISEICNAELEHALSYNKLIVPLVARTIDYKDVVSTIGKFNFIFANGDESMQEEAFQKVLIALHQDWEYMELHSRLHRLATHWEKDKSALILSGKKLAEAERFLIEASKGYEPRPHDIHYQYIKHSREKATQKKEKQQQFIVVLLLAVLTALLLVVYSLISHRKATKDLKISNQLVEQLKLDLEQCLSG